ncbi:hypothetical protein D3C85_173350 [compost metagenome]
MIPEFITIDYLDEARGRVTEQFSSKIIIDKLLQLLISQQQELQQVFQDLLQKRSIDEATGAQLDIIGEIVGQPRELISVDLFNFFGFLGVPKADSFGDFGNPVVGSKFYNFGTPLGGNVLLDDDTYRLFIKSKILKNNTASTPEEFIQFINTLFGTTSTFIVEGPEAQFIVFFGRPLSLFEQNLLTYVSSSQGYPSRLIPKTVGVGIGFGVFEEGNYFGFQGAPGAKGFGDFMGTYGYGLGYGLGYGDSDWEPGVGGIFAELI